ncbi:MAG TPA: hypothetical protein VKT82_08865 [Ktedonobacterales bacterium]|nr:hypothetical protein [Ktedonobacterales bacterium]
MIIEEGCHAGRGTHVTPMPLSLITVPEARATHMRKTTHFWQAGAGGNHLTSVVRA